MFGTAPKWIQRLPELDRAALMDLRKNSGGDLSKPREMIHCLYDIKSDADAREISNYLQKAGWTSSVSPSVENPQLLSIEAKKNSYIITEELYLSDRAFFNRISDLYSAHYDGWYASN